MNTIIFMTVYVLTFHIAYDIINMNINIKIMENNKYENYCMGRY